MAGNNLKRFIDAQSREYQDALAEIKQGKKRGHWIWYIFPQIDGLGFSTTSKFYAIKDLHEAVAYLADPILGERLKEISTALLGLESNDAHRIFGRPDELKLRSSMTLFSLVPNADPVFEAVLDKFFKGSKDEKTLALILKI